MITILSSDNGNVSMVDTVIIEGDIVYARSLNIIDGYMYIPDAFGKIYKIDYLNGFNVVETYSVDDSIAGMNYLCKLDNYYYLSIYTGNNFDKEYPSKLIRALSIEDIANNNYEDISDIFNFNGTPYFISEADGRYIVTEIDDGNCIYTFSINNDTIEDVSIIFKWDNVNDASLKRKAEVIG